MALTKPEIQEVIDTAKAGKPALTVIDNPSSTSIWKLIRDAIVDAYYTLEQLRDAYKSEIAVIASEAVAGTPAWYAAKALEFQVDSTLVFDGVNYIPKYDNTGLTAEEIAAKRIVKKVSVVELNGQVLLKLAKDDGGNLVPLAPDELVQFQAYINKLKFAGVVLNVISIDPDVLKITKTVFYNGQLDQNDVKAAVEAAEVVFLQGISFDGIFMLNEYVKALRAIPGVYDVFINLALAKPDSGDFQNVTRIYAPTSGYFVYDPLTQTNTVYTAQ